MTAEIAIYNRSALALAADSAVTTTLGSSQKIYNNAEKLFQLSKHHPVGIMIYNNASLVNSPWELLIKSYRRYINADCFDTIEDYSNSFFDFICQAENIITEAMEDDFFFGVFSLQLLQPIISQVQNFDVAQALAQGIEVSVDYFHERISALSNLRSDFLEQQPFYEGFTQDDIDKATEMATKYTLTIASQFICIDEKIDGGYPQELINSLIRLFSLSVCKHGGLSIFSGIVIAGYGDKEFYPVLQAYNVYGVFRGKMMKVLDEVKSQGNFTSRIIPFAQDEEVLAFIQGANSTLIEYFENLND